MTDNQFNNLCKKSIMDYYREHSPFIISTSDVFVVWQCKTLQNFKAILSTRSADRMLFECSYNGDKDEMYLDCYNKILNKTIKGDAYGT